MPDALRLLARLAVTGSLLCGGCSWFSSSPEQEIALPPQRTVTLSIEAASVLNPSPSGQSQPVKLCVIELSQQGWMPPGLYRGQACSGIVPNADVLSVTPFIVTPGGRYDYQRQLPWQEARWLLVAAEFQRPGADSGLLTLEAAARADYHAVVQVDGNRLLPGTPPQPME